MIKIIILLVLLFFYVEAMADDRPWTQKEIALATASTSLYLMDWATTKDMTRRYDEGFYERGPLVKMMFGNRPTAKQIDSYFALVIPGHLLLADKFPEHRQFILNAVIAVELLTVINNRSVGLNFKF
jgi:hypothetical protein